MKRSLRGFNLLVVLTIAGGQIALAEAASARERSSVSKQQSFGQFQEQITNDPIPLLSELERPATTIEEWMAQSSEVVQITDIQINATDAGVEIVLVSESGMLPVPSTQTVGNALIAEIPNAVLALPGEDEFQVFDPVEGIASIEAVTLTEQTVRLTIAGTEAPPVAEIEAEAQGLRLNVALGDATPPVADEEEIEIVVTAEPEDDYFVPNATTGTRTDTPLRDIPQSIQVVPQEVLEDQQVTELDDALRNVSGVVSSEVGSDSLRFIIRGFDDPSILRDGFRLTFRGVGNPGNQELSNVETVEVLKGPASILFGSLEPGGVINLVTEQPTSEPFYELGLRVGNRTLIEPRLDFSGPLTGDGHLLYRLNALYRTENSVQDYDTDFDRFFIAPVLSWQISDRTDLTVNFEYLDSEGPVEAGLVALGDEIADIPFDRVLGEPDDFFQTEIIRVGYDFEHRFSDNWKIRNAFRYNRRDFETSQFAFFSLNESTGDVVNRVFAFQEQTQSAFELQTNVVGEFNTGAIEHRLLAGIDLFRYDNPLSTRIDFLPPGFNIFEPVFGTVPRPDPATVPLSNDREFQTDTLGAYIQDQIDLLDNLILLVGVRYETFEQETIFNPTDLSPTGSESSQSDDAFSPRIGLVYQPTEEVSLYGSFSRSFLPNSATNVDGEILPPERGEQFELGARTELLDGRLSANLALFHLTKQNVATPDPDDPLGIASIAIGEQRSRGVELDMAGEILPGWNIIANYAYTDADITEDNEGLEGNRLFGVPEHNVNLWTTYEIQSGSLEGLSFGLGFNYVSERFGDNANSFTVDSYFLTNAAVAYARANWRAGLNIRNLFDIDYVEGVRNSRTIFNNPGAGLTIIGSFSIEF